MPRFFDIQGHRGCRGMRPESTLPAFETALDLGVTTLELDLHFTRDQVPVVWHDPTLAPKHVRWRTTPAPAKPPAIAGLTFAELRYAIADQNPDPKLWPEQKAEATPAAKAWLAAKQPAEAEVYRLISLAELFEFVTAYAQDAGKTETQRRRAAAVRFNVETKRNPSRPETINDGFDGVKAGPFEQAILAAVRQAGVLERFVLQSFDHRSLRAAKALEPKLKTAALFEGKPTDDVLEKLKAAQADLWSPNHSGLTAAQVRAAQAAGFRVVPWTANTPTDIERILDMETDGLITDYPNRLIPKVQAQHWEY